jgi:hypothetical protein
MGVGDVSIWTMSARHADLPTDAGEWQLDFVVDEFPPIKGRFILAVQLLTGDDELIAVHRTQHAFDVASEHKVGILNVDYRLESTALARA